MKIANRVVGNRAGSEVPAQAHAQPCAPSPPEGKALTYTSGSDGTFLVSDGVSETVQGQWATHTGTPGVTAAQTYAYDASGRTTALPSSTGTNRQTWTLDSYQRFRAWTTETNNSGTWTTTATKTNHYRTWRGYAASSTINAVLTRYEGGSAKNVWSRWVSPFFRGPGLHRGRWGF